MGVLVPHLSQEVGKKYIEVTVDWYDKIELSRPFTILSLIDRHWANTLVYGGRFGDYECRQSLRDMGVKTGDFDNLHRTFLYSPEVQEALEQIVLEPTSFWKSQIRKLPIQIKVRFKAGRLIILGDEDDTDDIQGS